MNEQFQIPVTYKGKELLFDATLKNYGYVHKIEVNVNGHTIILEEDEESLYRVVVPYDNALPQADIDMELVGLIAKVLTN